LELWAYWVGADIIPELKVSWEWVLKFGREFGEFSANAGRFFATDESIGTGYVLLMTSAGTVISVSTSMLRFSLFPSKLFIKVISSC
jgi:hypothetical protein